MPARTPIARRCGSGSSSFYNPRLMYLKVPAARRLSVPAHPWRVGPRPERVVQRNRRAFVRGRDPAGVPRTFVLSPRRRGVRRAGARATEHRRKRHVPELSPGTAGQSDPHSRRPAGARHRLRRTPLDLVAPDAAGDARSGGAARRTGLRLPLLRPPRGGRARRADGRGGCLRRAGSCRRHLPGARVAHSGAVRTSPEFPAGDRVEATRTGSRARSSARWSICLNPIPPSGS